MEVLAFFGHDLYFRGEPLWRPIVVDLHDKLFQFDSERQFVQVHIGVECPPLHLVDGGEHFEPLHVGIAQGGAGESDEESEVVEQEGDVAPPMEVVQMPQRDEPQDEGHIDIDEHEGPEGEHVVESSAVDGLPGESHHDGERHGIGQCGHRRLEGAEESEGVDLASAAIGSYDEQYEHGEHDDIGGPCEDVPVDGAYGQFEQ